MTKPQIADWIRDLLKNNEKRLSSDARLGIGSVSSYLREEWERRNERIRASFYSRIRDRRRAYRRNDVRYLRLALKEVTA